MSDGSVYWAVIEPVCDSISIYDGPARFLSEHAAAPTVARTLFAAHWCQSEVCNGGFEQFFSNSTGVLGPEAILAFHEIGMPLTSSLIANAAAYLGEPYP